MGCEVSLENRRGLAMSSPYFFMKPRSLQQLLFFCLLLCTSTGLRAQATFDHHTRLYDKNKNERAQQLTEALRQVRVPQLASEEITTDWMFFTGNPSEGLITQEVEQRGERVVLPHRLEKADHPFWYTCVMTVREPGVLTIRGDDGVQLFIDGVRVPRMESDHFRIGPGTLKVTVRVLNNAMAGGLRTVKFSDLKSYMAYQHQLKLYQRLVHLAEKAMLMRSLPTGSLEQVLQAIRTFDDSTVSAAEHTLQDFPMLTGPYLQSPSTGSITVMCGSDARSPIELYFGESKDRLLRVGQQHSTLAAFELGTLRKNRRYYYQVRCGKTFTEVYSFTTPAEGKPFTFNVWADSQSGWEAFAGNMKQISAEDDAFGIAAGDLVADGFDAEHWRRFLNIVSLSAARRPYYFIAGNHDYDGYYEDLKPENYLRYTRNQPARYFSWTWQNAVFIALDPNETFPIGVPEASAQYTWFHDRIRSEEWKNATWRFVMMHQPPYSQGWPGYHGDECMRRLLEPVMESAKIDFVISGHTHDYERLTKQFGKQKTTFLIVGGGGGSLEPEGSSSDYPVMDKVIKTHHFGRFRIDGNTVMFQALNASGAMIDSYQVKKP